MGNRNPLLWLSATVLTLLIIALMVSQDVTANVEGWPKRVGAGYGVVNIARKHCDTRAQEKNLQWKGRYTNPEYGYSLAIPHGLIGVTPSSPLPQHTIEILISTKRDARILASAYMNASDYYSLDAAVDYYLKDSEKNIDDPKIVTRERAWLGRLAAIRVVVHYREKATGATIIKEEITAIRSARHPEQAVLYTLTLVTSDPRYARDKRIFKNVLQSWRLRPMPK